jgi:thiamine pyrophosphokinase
MSILLQYVATEGVAWSATIVHHPVSSSANIQNTTVGLPSNISTKAEKIIL